MPAQPTEIASDPVKLGVSFATEALVPGGSNLVKGDLATGALHFAAGLAARAAIGLPGVMLVSANSISKAVTGQSLLEQLGVRLPTCFDRTPQPATPRK